MSTRSTDPAEFLRLLHRPDEIFEIRAPNCATQPGGIYTATASGYFRGLANAPSEIKKLETRKPPGTYVTINPCDSSLYARAKERINPKARDTTNDAGIVSRGWLLLDLDPMRASGISATDAEMEAALDLARHVLETLANEQWPAPLIGMSGNGSYLFYRIDQPNDTESTDLVKRVLGGLAIRFNTEKVTIDVTTFNASRIAKVLGTTARKGDDLRGVSELEDRPHRQSWFEPPAAELLTVTRELLEAVATKSRPSLAKDNAPPRIESAHIGNGQASAVERCRAYVTKLPDAISGQGGHSTTLTAACECIRFGLSDDESCTIMQEFNANKTGGEPWKNEELEHKLRDARTKVEAAGEVGIKLKQPEANSAAGTGVRPYDRFTSAELDAGEFQQEYLIEHTLVAGQPCIAAGGKKTLKTNLFTDMAISLATASPFLGKLRVNRTANVAFMSGESGLATLQETARRICQSKALHLGDITGVVWSPDLPDLADKRHEAVLAQFLKDEKIEVVVLDPAYLMMPGTDAGNLFVQGAMLRRLTAVCGSVGSTIILVHHTKKGGADQFQAPELDDIAWAGFQEFARQWLLLGRRKLYEPGTGSHRLWLNVGGSAGHSRLWALDIDEGAYDGYTPRRWEVELLPPTDARRDAELEQLVLREEKKQAKLELEIANLARTMTKFPDGETKTTLRTLVGMSGDKVNAALAIMIAKGSVEECEVFKSNHKTPQPGFKLNAGLSSPLGSPGQDHPDNPSATCPPLGRTPLYLREASESECMDDGEQDEF